jgi:geranylgeranyl pyrophosphate synthase
MAGMYDVVISSGYKPFSYQDLIAPVASAQEAHNAMLNELSALDAQTAATKGLINPESQSGKVLNQYREDLNRVYEDLNSSGINAQTKKRALELRSKYASQVAPIENAFKAKQE